MNAARAEGLIARVYARLAGSRSGLALGLLAAVVPIVLQLCLPAISTLFVDGVLIRGQHHWIAPLLWALVIIAVLHASFRLLYELAAARLEAKLIVTGGSRFCWRLLRLPLAFFTRRMTGDLVEVASADVRVSTTIVAAVLRTPPNLFLVAGFALSMFYLAPGLAAAVIAASAANFAAIRWVAGKRKEKSRLVARLRGALNGVSSQGLELIETLKASGAEPDFFARWLAVHARTANARQALQRSTFVIEQLTPLVVALGTVLVLGLGAREVIGGSMTIGALVAFQLLASGFFPPFRGLMELGRTAYELDSDLERVAEVLSEPEDIQFGIAVDPAAALSKLSGRVALRHVTFGYDQGRPPLIEDLSLALEPGARIALVGRSGSGKTTIGRLISGTLQPWSGEIELGGLSPNRLPRSIRASSIGLVEQNITLFQGTVRDNLTSWDPTLTDAELIRAAKDACIHDEISSRPGRYDSRVEEGGANFSGGQRQRLELARALSRSPAILVLDEATSALDPETEARIDDNLRRRGCTTIVIAHRLSTIRDADEIIVLEGGRVAERGRHEALLAQGGIYRELISAAGLSREREAE